MSQDIPLVIGNVMYIVSPYSQAIALNATTGEVIWKYDIPDNDIPSSQARGAAYWPGADGVPASIIFGSAWAGFIRCALATASPTPLSARTASST